MNDVRVRRGDRRDLLVVVQLASVGALAGVAAKVADESSWRWTADLGSYPAAWVLAVALIGRLAPSAGWAAVRAGMCFLLMTIAYYGWAQLVLGFGWSRAAGAWLLLSVAAVPAIAAAVRWSIDRGPMRAGAVLAMAASAVLAGGVVRQQWLVAIGDLPVEAGHPVQAVADIVVVTVLVLVLPRGRAARVWAALLVLPMAWLVGEALDQLSRVLYLG